MSSFIYAMWDHWQAAYTLMYCPYFDVLPMPCCTNYIAAHTLLYHPHLPTLDLPLPFRDHLFRDVDQAKAESTALQTELQLAREAARTLSGERDIIAGELTVWTKALEQRY